MMGGSSGGQQVQSGILGGMGGGANGPQSWQNSSQWGRLQSAMPMPGQMQGGVQSNPQLMRIMNAIGMGGGMSVPGMQTNQTMPAQVGSYNGGAVTTGQTSTSGPQTLANPPGGSPMTPQIGVAGGSAQFNPQLMQIMNAMGMGGGLPQMAGGMQGTGGFQGPMTPQIGIAGALPAGGTVNPGMSQGQIAPPWRPTWGGGWGR